MARGRQLFKGSQTQVQAAEHSNKETNHLKVKYQERECVELMEHLTRRRNETWQKAKMIFFTFALIFGSLSLAALLGYWFFSLDSPTGRIYIHDLYLHVTFNTSRYFELRSGSKHSDLLLLKGNLGLSIPKVSQFNVLEKNSTNVHIKWDPYAELKLVYSQNAKGSATCYEFIWKGHGGVLRNKLEDCLELGNSKWYGTFMNNNNDIESLIDAKWYWTRQEEVWKDFDSLSFTEDDITLERYWLSSNGVGIRVASDVPLKARATPERNIFSLCFKAAHRNYSMHNPYSPLFLSYSVCKSSNIKSIHEYMIQKYNMHAIKSNDEGFLSQDTLWMSPYDKTLSKGINPLSVQHFAQHLLDSGYQNSGIVVDIDVLVGKILWQRRASDEADSSTSLFIPTRVSVVLRKISSMGFCLVIKVPFVKLLHYSISSEVSYQSNKCNIECVNLYDEAAVSIFKNHMLSVLSDFRKQYHVCSFMLDMRAQSRENSVPSPHLQNIAQYLLNSMENCCPSTISNAAFGVQKASLFIKMSDILPNWSHQTGLKSVIPKALTLSILGYPYIIPPAFKSSDHISANTTAETSTLSLPDAELYIRWFQLISLFPSRAVTLTPWSYPDSNVSGVIKEANKSRNQLLPTILQLVKKSKLGQTILRPLWWLEPNNRRVQRIDDEFMIGDAILVAPVLNPGSQSRDIYFPSGYWKDQRLSLTLKGGQWYRNYETSINHLPYFLKTSEA